MAIISDHGVYLHEEEMMNVIKSFNEALVKNGVLLPKAADYIDEYIEEVVKKAVVKAPRVTIIKN